MSGLKKKAVVGIIWSSIERFSAQGIQFILGLILARILLPSDYGLVGMILIFLAISQTFIDSGFGNALIQKKNRDEIDFSTTFYFNIIVSILIYAILFLSAPLIANFYKQPQLIHITRVTGLTLVVGSLSVVQKTRYTINLDFKTLTKASLSSILISGILGIFLAYEGYGVWALVWQILSRRIIETIVLWFFSKWLPLGGFSYNRFRKLFSYGSKLLLAGLINSLYNNIYLIVIGKMFSAEILGYYTRAQQFANFPSSNITIIIQRVTFPLLSPFQDDDEKLRNIYRKIVKLSALLIFPCMIGLAALAEPIIRIILTEKWLQSAWMLQLLAFALMWYPIHALNLNVLNIKGRTDLYLRLEVIKKIVITVILIISVPLGIKAIIWGQIVTSFLAIVINTHYTKKILSYGFYNQSKDLFGVLTLSLSMGVIIYFTISIFQTDFTKILIGIIEGGIFYISIALGLNIGEIKMIKNLVKNGMVKKFKDDF